MGYSKKLGVGFTDRHQEHHKMVRVAQHGNRLFNPTSMTTKMPYLC